jgi:23S rRNA (adenine2503-C2)-methyltransferase
MKHPSSAEEASPPRRNLYGLERAELESLLAPFLTREFQGRQIYHWLYGRRETDLGAMTDLPAGVRAALRARFRIEWPSIRESRDSTDGSRKYVLALEDGAEIEAVFILYGERVTLCLSSQVGCPLACRFCLTGTMGLVRNLTAGEIAGQVAVVSRDKGFDPRSIRVVFMGMGEPLNNLEPVLAAFRILTDPEGFGIPARKVTLSTAGLVPGIERLALEASRPRLAISLGAAHDLLRDELMPINRKYNLENLVRACRSFPLGPREAITFEYVLLAGMNDGPLDAARLARLTRGLKIKVNVIPYNEAGVEGYETPSQEAAARFRDALRARGVTATIRWSKGRDIGAACGQLVRSAAAR